MAYNTEKYRHECDRCGKPIPQDTTLCKECAEYLERKGHWIPNKYFYGIYDYTCSECEKHSEERSAFCPNCGAKMESEDKE